MLFCVGITNSASKNDTWLITLHAVFLVYDSQLDLRCRCGALASLRAGLGLEDRGARLSFIECCTLEDQHHIQKWPGM